MSKISVRRSNQLSRTSGLVTDYVRLSGQFRVGEVDRINIANCCPRTDDTDYYPAISLAHSHEELPRAVIDQIPGPPGSDR